MHPTNRSAPFVNGIYALQAVSSATCRPDLTFYRSEISDALRVKDGLARGRGHDRFLLHHAAGKTDTYAKDGKLPRRELGNHRDTYCFEGHRPLCEPGHQEPEDPAVASYVQRAIGADMVRVCSTTLCRGSSVILLSNFFDVLAWLARDVGSYMQRHIVLAESNSSVVRRLELFANLRKLKQADLVAYHVLVDHQMLRRPIDPQTFKRRVATRLAGIERPRFVEVLNHLLQPQLGAAWNPILIAATIEANSLPRVVRLAELLVSKCAQRPLVAGGYHDSDGCVFAEAGIKFPSLPEHGAVDICAEFKQLSSPFIAATLGVPKSNS